MGWDPGWDLVNAIEADLDRAIAQLERNIIEAAEDAETLAVCRRALKQARADVVKLRDVIQFEVFQDHIPNDPDTNRVWTDTESYEQYRKGSSGPDGAAGGLETHQRAL